MQDLRDKLLKAGLVDKKKARQLRTETRRKKKRRGGERAAAGEAERRAERFADKRAQQAERARQAQSEVDAARREAAQRHRLTDLVSRRAVRLPDDDRALFYFVGPDRRIRRLRSSWGVKQQLTAGQLAIVAAPEDRRQDYRVVPAEVAARVEEIDRSQILFWVKPGDQELPTYGASGPHREESDPP